MAPFHPFEVTPVHLAYTILGAFIVLFGMFSLFVKEKLFIGEAVIATVVGIIAGPYVTGGFDPTGWGGGEQHITDEITLELTRVVIAISVLAIGIELPKAYVKKHWKTIAFLLGPVMVYGWFVSAAIIYGIIPGVSFLSALVIAACVTPTDPILASAVIGGKFAQKHVPAHLRHMLAVESGCNDGAAFPFLYIALYLTLDASDAHAVEDWFLVTWLYEVVLGIVLGSILGYVVRRLMKFSEQHQLVDRSSFVAQYLSLAILSIGIVTLLGSDDLLAAFCAGTAFAWDGWFNKATEESNFSNVIDLLFNVTAFLYVGAIIPFDRFADAELTLSVWRLVVLVIAILFIRRLPAMFALYRWIPDIHTFREAVFVGHFGPMGIGAIFISTLASTKLPEPVYPPTNQVELLADVIQPIVHFIVLGSVLVHGLSIPFFSLGRQAHSIARTHSIGLTRTNDSRMRSRSRDNRERVEPAWLSTINRVIPGQDIVINKDEEAGPEVHGPDGEADVADGGKLGLGIAQDPKTDGSDLNDKDQDNSSGRSSTAAGSGSGETKDERGEKDALTNEGDHVGKEHVKNFQSPKTRPGETSDEEVEDEEREAKREEGEESEEERELEAQGRKDPPLREFREGPHLVIEKYVDGDVEVEVHRNHYHKHRPQHKYKFRGPEADVRAELADFFERVKDDMEDMEVEFKNAFKHMLESSHVRDERHAREDAEQEAKEEEAAEERKEERKEETKNDKKEQKSNGKDKESGGKKKAGGGVSLTRTERIQDDEDEDASDGYEDEDDSPTSSSHNTPTGPTGSQLPPAGTASADFAAHPSPSSRRNSNPRPPQTSAKRFGKRHSLRNKLFGGSNSPSLPSRPTVSSPLHLSPNPDAVDLNRASSTSSSQRRPAQTHQQPSPSHSRTPSIRFTDSPRTLTPTSTTNSSSLPSHEGQSGSSHQGVTFDLPSARQ